MNSKCEKLKGKKFRFWSLFLKDFFIIYAKDFHLVKLFNYNTINSLCHD